MWEPARKLVAFVVYAVASFSALSMSAHASQCSDVYPGAERGPPADWSWWGFGGACHVQWPVRNAQEERQKSSQCHNTSGAYYILFEGNKGTGHVTCIFSFPDKPVLADKTSTPPSSLSSETDRKSDLSQVPEVPENRKPKAFLTASVPAAAATSEIAASASVTTASGSETFSTTRKKLADKTVCATEKHSAAKNGADPCQPRNTAKIASEPPAARDKKITKEATSTRVAAIGSEEGGVPETGAKRKKPSTDIQPAATSYDDPDPARLSQTQSCSSLALGNSMTCLNPPTRREDGTYVFTVKPNCSAGLLAAIGTTDGKGKCIRKVIKFSPEHKRSQAIESASAPVVLDAVPYRSQAGYACYTRRHNEISCDGKINYAPKLAGDLTTTARDGTAAPSTTHFIKRRKPQPTIIDSFFGKVKQIFTSQ